MQSVKGQLVWENIRNWVLVLIFAIVILVMIYFNREMALEIIDDMKEWLRFGV
jgi:hypothetical protein